MSKHYKVLISGTRLYYHNLAFNVRLLYQKDKQQTIDIFILPFRGALSADNRWIKKADMIPWADIEGDYSDLFPGDSGNVAKPARLAFDALIIKETLWLTDEETVEQIRENTKLAISVIDGFAYLEKLSWENFNEGVTLIESVERYRHRYGFYPKSVHVDKIYRTRDYIRYCHKHGIRISGPKLGRPPK